MLTLELVILVNKKAGKLYTHTFGKYSKETELKLDEVVVTDEVAIFPIATINGLKEEEKGYYLADVDVTQKEFNAMHSGSLYSGVFNNRQVTVLHEVTGLLGVVKSEKIYNRSDKYGTYKANLVSHASRLLSYKLSVEDHVDFEWLVKQHGIENAKYPLTITLTKYNMADIPFYVAFDYAKYNVKVEYDCCAGFNGYDNYKLTDDDFHYVFSLFNKKSIIPLLVNFNYFQHWDCVGDLISAELIERLIAINKLEDVLIAYDLLKGKEVIADKMLAYMDHRMYALKDDEYEPYYRASYDEYHWFEDDYMEQESDGCLLDERVEEVDEIKNVLPYVTLDSITLLTKYHYSTIEPYLSVLIKEKLEEIKYS